MQELNIVLVNDFGSSNGGASQVAIDTALGLGHLGYRVYYFCAILPIDARLTTNKNIQVICTNQKDILTNSNRFQAFFSGLWNYKSARIFTALLSSLPPDKTVVHVHGWTKALSHSVVYKALRMKFPVIITLHDYFVACPNGGFYNYPCQQICHLRALSPKCILTNCDSRNYFQKLWRIARGLIQKYFVRLPAGINSYISVSRLSKEILMPYLPSTSQVFFQPNLIKTANMGRVEAEKNSKIIAVGRLSPEKGFELLARAAKELGVEVEFIGDGEVLNKLKKLNSNANFTGWLEKDELFKRIRKGRVLVFSSKWYETQGLVVLEAASQGIPAIVSDATAANELIVNNETGVLFKNNDLEDLKRKLIAFCEDSFVSQLSMNTYKKFWENFQTSEKYSKAVVEIYNFVLSNNQKQAN